MRIVTDEQVESLGISPSTCVDWVTDGFRLKKDADMPVKVSVHPYADSYCTTMPCYHSGIGRIAIKVVTRVPGVKPTIKSKTLLLDAKSGDVLALLDSNWITAARTAATAVLSAKTLARDFEHASFGLVGLGVVGKAVLRCLLDACSVRPTVWLMRYKDHTDIVQDEIPGADYHVAESREELVANADTLFSCVTVMHDQFMPQEAYAPGCTIIPVHVRGFQDCDTAFDKVFGDDERHMRTWDNFGKYKRFCELGSVLSGESKGRESPDERIISYNYGLAIHDLLFAARIYDIIQ